VPRGTGCAAREGADNAGVAGSIPVLAITTAYSGRNLAPRRRPWQRTRHSHTPSGSPFAAVRYWSNKATALRRTLMFSVLSVGHDGHSAPRIFRCPCTGATAYNLRRVLDETRRYDHELSIE
jgi:hypothetical protein